MASSVIHIVIANEINKKLNRDTNQLLIGSVAPDISKLVGETRIRSHFLDSKDNSIPNINKFLEKYQSKLDDDFVLGYFIHLYTDYLWFKYFIPEIRNNDYVTKLDGTIVKCDESTLLKYIYNDYTNLNIRLLDEYNIDIVFLDNDLPNFANIIDEIPMNKINLLIEQISNIIENTKVKKDYIFNINNIETFIQTSIDLIIGKLQELNIL